MRDFDPHRIASEWHSGQGSALYAYASTDRIPTEEFKNRLVWEIEKSMAHADDEGLDELEYLLMHVEEQHPDRYLGSEMHEGDDDIGNDEDICYGCGKKDGHEGPCMPKPEDEDEVNEAWATVDPVTGDEIWNDVDDVEIRDLYLSPEAFNDSPHGEVCKVCGSIGCGCIAAKPKPKREEDAFCEVCGGTEGQCECVMNEVEPRILRHESSLKDAVLRIMAEVADDEDDGNKCPECGGPPGKHDRGCPNMDESVSPELRRAVSAVVKEMKLGIASRGHFDFGQPDDPEDDFVTNFLMAKKEKDKEAEAKASDKKSGTKLKTARKRSKSSQFR